MVWAGRLNYLLGTLEVVCVHVSLSQCFLQPVSIRVWNEKGSREGGRQKEKKQLVCKGWAEFLNDLIPVSAVCLTVGIPVSPRDNGNSSSHQPTSVSPQHLFSLLPLTSLPIFYCVPLWAWGQPAESPFEYDGRGVFSEEQQHSVSCARPGLVIHLWPCNGDGYCTTGRLKWKRYMGQ